VNQSSYDISHLIDAKRLCSEVCDDISIMVAGQGGDGSLTIIALISRALLNRGYHIYRTSNIASRIKGGHAAALMRASTKPRSNLGDHIDLLIAFDIEAVEKAADRLADDAVIIFDSSRGAIPAERFPDKTLLIPVPFSRLGRIMGISDDEVEHCLRNQFKKLSQAQFEPNLLALREGQAFADSAGIGPGNSIFALPEQPKQESRMFIMGNDAVAMGFLAAGGRFFAGYPITPATDIMNFLARHSAPLGGLVMQAEDELAAINLSIGAALTGVRSMTASSGPGIALMQESIGHCGSAEIPLVIVDCQRSGPSTGMPTKPEQSDINMLTRGGNGDFPHIVLAPGTVKECFEFGAFATNLAQRAQCPVIIALDAICHDSCTSEQFDLSAIEIDQAKRLTQDDVAELEEYKRYLVTDDGISPWAVPGTPGGMNLVTGNERDEWGRVSTEAANRVVMMDKRSRKIETVRPLLPVGVEAGDENATIGIVATGILDGVITEAIERLALQGRSYRLHRPRTLWPVLDDTIEFINSHEKVFVVEQNEGAQLASLLRGEGANADRIVSILKYDGLQFTVRELIDALLAGETS